MLITQFYSWPTINWPSSTAANQYTIFQIYPTPITQVSTITGTTTTLSYDDASTGLVYQVRPSSGPINAPTTFGPEVATFVVGYVPCRAWLRQKIRQSLADRTDTVNVTINWPDDEINNYIQEALSEFNVMFPLDNNTTIAMIPPTIQNGVMAGVRNYALPADFYAIKTIEYVTVNGQVRLYLKEKPWRGGESTANTFTGYPKLGILLPPRGGRFFVGNYFIFENQLWLDWDPTGNGDYINVNYTARRPLPVGDADLIGVYPEDMELLSLRTQMKAWLRVESQDTRLSRWRSRDDGSKRDDMPTIKHSDVIKKLYNELVNDRRELRVKTKRLVRR